MKSTSPAISPAGRLSICLLTLLGLVILSILLVACDGAALSEPEPGRGSVAHTPSVLATKDGSGLVATIPPVASPPPTTTLVPTPTSTSPTTGCFFSPYNIGGQVPVYRSPDITSPIVTEIASGKKYAVLDRQGEWRVEEANRAGHFYQIQIDTTNLGWVIDMRGGLEGDCAPYQDQVKKPPIFTGQIAPANNCSFEPSTIVDNSSTSTRPVRVVFIAEDGIRLWDEETNTTELLFQAGDITSLAFSDDHQRIAFTRRSAERQASVWMMDGQGQAARELLSPEGLLALNLSEDKDLAVDPYNLRWIPGSHRLAFSTRTTTAGDGLPDVFEELRVLDADSGLLTQVLDHDQGGTFTYSPDGAFFTLATDTAVDLYRSDGELLAADVVTYPALGITDHYYRPSVYWDANSRSFTFALINAADNMDAFYNPDVTSTIWRVKVEGTAERLATIHGMSLDHSFSPDLEKVAFMRVSPRDPRLRELHIADVYYAWDVTYREGDTLTFGDWNPVEETLHFTFFDGWGEPAVGRLCYDPVPLPSVAGPGSTRRVSWVDAARYLYTTHPEEALYLGSLTTPHKPVGQLDREQMTGETGPLRVYDYYVAPGATSNTPADDAQPGPDAFGIYLLVEDRPATQVTSGDLISLELQDRPLISIDDIVFYDGESHEMELSAAAYGRVQALFTLPARVDGIPFVVRVGDEPIYAGAFWTPLSSLSYDGVTIMQPLGDQDDMIRLALGYPSPIVFTGQDPRADPRIIEALSKADKLR